MAETERGNHPDTMADVIRQHACARGPSPCIWFEGRETTYRQLDERASQVANRLLDAGLRRQGRVAVLAKNTDAFFELYYGACKANVVLVPVNFRLAPPEVRYVIDDAQAEILFVSADYYDLVAAVEGRLQTVKLIVCLDGRPAGAGPAWQDFRTWRDAGSATDPLVAVDSSDTALQIYSSGTTGHPKGVELTHRNLLVLIGSAIGEWDAWSPDDVVQVVMPLFHVAGCEWAFVGFHLGARIILHAEVDPPAILDGLSRHGVTKTLYVPAVILFLLQTPGVAEADFSRLQSIYYGASPIPLPVLERAVKIFGCGFTQLYGLTETTGAVTRLAPEDHRGERMRSCGKPIATAEVRVVDESGEDCAPGTVGEIIVAGPQIMKGYWNLPEETARAVRGRWFYSGDAGYFDAEGYLYIYDRMKDMIVSGGENIYPAEIESVLAGHPMVADVAVIGVPDEKWGETVKAVVVPQAGQAPDAGVLDTFARANLAGYKVPRSYEFTAELPRNPSGKILKRVLRAPYWEGRERQVN